MLPRRKRPGANDGVRAISLYIEIQISIRARRRRVATLRTPYYVILLVNGAVALDREWLTAIYRLM